MRSSLESTKRFNELLEESTNRMSSLYLSGSFRDIYPATMFSSSYFNRFINNLIVNDLKKIMKKSGYTLDEMFSKHDSDENTHEYMEQMKEVYETNKSLNHKLAKIALNIQRKKYPGLNNPKPALEFKDTIAGYSKEYLRDMEEYQRKYGGQFFSPSAISRAGSNTMAMRLFAYGNNLPSPPKKAMYAISLLHPLTDDYMDKSIIDKQVITGISQKLAHIDVPTSNPYEGLIYDLIDDLFEDYPPGDYPVLSHILENLHNEQIRSLKQKDMKIDLEDIVDISLRKGGLSTLAAGHIALGGLTERQFKFFYEIGGLFQLIDDFSDTAEDIGDGVNTIWTSDILRGKKCDKSLYQTLGLHKDILERTKKEYALDFARPNFAVNLYEHGFKMLALRGFYVNENYFEKSAQKLVKKTLPLNYNKVRSLMLYLHPRINGVLTESSLD